MDFKSIEYEYRVLNENMECADKAQFNPSCALDLTSAVELNVNTVCVCG